MTDREEVTKDEDFHLAADEDDDDEEWEGEIDWTTEETEESGDVKDEGAAYLDFLNKEVRHSNMNTAVSLILMSTL
jgi:importin-7